MKHLNTHIKLLFCLVLLPFMAVAQQNNALKSIDTKETIMKVRPALFNGEKYIIASTYDGDIMAIDYSNGVKWQVELDHGIMNHDLICSDINGDKIDEIIVASANGTLYCLNSRGEKIWKFKRNDVPLYAVTVVEKEGRKYIVCSGYDLNLYYLSTDGLLVKKLHASEYSTDKLVRINDGKRVPKDSLHSVNFLKTYKKSNGDDVLIVQGQSHTMNVIGARGEVYFFNPLEDKPYMTHYLETKGASGSCVVNDLVDGGEVLFGASELLSPNGSAVSITTGKEKPLIIGNYYKAQNKSQFGYRVVQMLAMKDNTSYRYIAKYGNSIIILPKDLDSQDAEILITKYSYNDIFIDNNSHKLVLASAQSGGSCVHIFDLTNNAWKQEYVNLEPKGKIASILSNSKVVREELATFKAPSYEKKPLPVYLMSENLDGIEDIANNIKKNYNTPIFLNSTGTGKQAENWERKGVVREQRFIDKRDQRRKYNLDRKDIVKKISSAYKGAPGISFWGGHGNDPYMFSMETHKQIIDKANGKKTVLIYPELAEHGEVFGSVLEDLIYPLADYCRGKNANLYIRTKYTFWQSVVYLPMWNGLLSGKYADVFVPSMEETTDKSMDLSVAARLGIWASGATDSWGSRCARDNPSFDRLRQFSNQMLPNHFLRMMVYHLSLGTQYIDNSSVDKEYMSLFWELVAKGAIYIPNKSEIVSFSPVHLSMVHPDEEWIEDVNNVKWTTFYTQEFEDNNKFVFSRISGTWPGAKVTDYDFSTYAAGVKDRRQNYLPTYKNGIVLITPAQKGVYADKDAPRGAMTNHLNPIYKDIMKEYYTDGRNYYSADGKEKYSADTYYKVIAEDIKNSAKLLPVNVEGRVAWVAAQSAPKHIRLTIIDGGYINPDDREVEITYNSGIKPVKIVDILSGKEIKIDNSKSTITVPCGMFRFLDIELEQELK